MVKRAFSARRATVAFLVAICLAITGCREGSDGVKGDPSNQTAVPASAAFTVTQELGAPTIRRGPTAVTVEIDLGPNPGSISATALPDGRVALQSSTRLAVVDAEGNGPSIPFPIDCYSVAGAAQHLIALCSSEVGSGLRFEIRILNSDLTGMRRLELSQVHEHSDPVYSQSPAKLLAVGPDAFWASYPDRGGYHRGGTQLLVKYDLEGRTLGSVRLDGLVLDSEVSPDGRFLAMLAGASEGNCNTMKNLRVVDLSGMQLLNTAPDTPAAALAEAHRWGDVWFLGQTLRWTSPDTVEAAGSTAHHGDGGCAVGERYWTRTFNVTAPGITDREIPPTTRPVVGWIGPACADAVVVLTDPGETTPTLELHRDGRNYRLRDAHLLVGAPAPQECGP